MTTFYGHNHIRVDSHHDALTAKQQSQIPVIHRRHIEINNTARKIVLNATKKSLSDISRSQIAPNDNIVAISNITIIDKCNNIADVKIYNALRQYITSSVNQYNGVWHYAPSMEANDCYIVISTIANSQIVIAFDQHY